MILQEQLLHREFRFYLLTTGTNRCARSFRPYQIRTWDVTCDAGWFFIACFWMVLVTVDDSVNLVDYCLDGDVTVVGCTLVHSCLP